MNHGVQIVFMFIWKKRTALVFTSDSDTRHGKEFAKNPLVAGSVVLETMIIGKIQGIQFQGIVSEPEGELLAKAKSSLSEKISCCSTYGYTGYGL